MPRTKFASDEERKTYYRERSAANRAKNPGKANEYCRKYRKAHPEVAKSHWAGYYEENKDKLRANGRAYYAVYKPVRQEKVAALEAAQPGIHARKYRERRDKDPVKALWKSCKQNAANKGLPFNLETGDLTMPTHCPVLGFELKHGEGKWCPTSPSVDRIIPELGYVKGNVIVVSWRANCLKRDATLDEIQKLAAFYTALLTPAS